MANAYFDFAQDEEENQNSSKQWQKCIAVDWCGFYSRKCDRMRDTVCKQLNHHRRHYRRRIAVRLVAVPLIGT